jgi:hypothetical protein
MPLPSPHYSRNGYEVWNAGTTGSEYGRAIWHGNNHPRPYGTHAYGPPQVHLSPEELIISPGETWQIDGVSNRIIDGPSSTGAPIRTSSHHDVDSDSIAPGGQNKAGKLLALAIAYSYGLPTLPKIKSLLEQDMQ